ncbi:MAG: ABC transporter ATP-binding protein/permease [Elusimicrobiota bacterium]|jgi:subfamily B ATP-binding cassette protein MsbA|nr:ABC transporter ATP-binding protein/permease [Elusimicrobiota bacterium]
MKKLIDKYVLQNIFVRNYRRMWPFIKPYWVKAAIALAFAAPIGSMDAAIAMLLKPFMDNVLVEKEVVFSSVLPLYIMGITLAQGSMIYVSGYLNTWVANKITLSVRGRLYRKLLEMDSAFFDKNNSGMVIQRFSSDAESAAGGLINNLKTFATRFFSSVSLVCVLIYNSWQLAIIAVAVLAVAAYPLTLVRKKIKEIMNRSVGAGAAITTLYNETFNGNRVIQSFNLEQHQQERFNKNTEVVFNLNMKMAMTNNWMSPFMHFIGSCGIAGVLALGSHFIINGTITSGNFVAFIAALMMLYTPLRSISGNYFEITRSFMAQDRIFDLLDAKPVIRSHNGSIELKNIEKNIQFKNVSFGYSTDADRRVLKNISFEVKMGQMVALVGNSGGGKTTISSLIPRLYEIQEGEILIDGVDIKQFTIDSLRHNISMVFQDNFLFDGTVKENIVLGNETATDEQIEAAVKNAYLDIFIDSLPQKLDTEIGERGILLSGGQKQRLAIARAFVKNAPLVILDEATSALDNKAEKVVQKALDNLMKNRTVIVIAHRLSTIINAHKILVINDGKIVEEGSHEQLLAMENGAYASLYKTEFKK